MRLELANTIFVFDLDDTLYSEFDYKESGMREVARVVSGLYSLKKEDTLFDLMNGEGDVFDQVCSKIGAGKQMKESLIWVYRNHFPDISLDNSVSAFLAKLAENSLMVAILTDGRSVTQRSKLRALGLKKIPAFISEEYSSEKPALKRFEIIQAHFPSADCVYIGDNPKKDFIGPSQLGWRTIGVRGNGRNIHSQDVSGFSEMYLPEVWIDNIDEIGGLLC